jgi:excisionase family DNA binding protein
MNKNSHIQPKYLTIPQAASYVAVSISTMRTWIRHGYVRAIAIGAVVRVSASELDAFMHRNARVVSRNAPRTSRGRYQRQSNGDEVSA